jgi:hypothetical protein
MFEFNIGKGWKGKRYSLNFRNCRSSNPKLERIAKNKF